MGGEHVGVGTGKLRREAGNWGGASHAGMEAQTSIKADA